MESSDLGQTWTEPQPVPSLGRDPTTDGRGDEGALLEPSVVRYRGRFYVTIRAEDSRGYVAASEDGLDFDEKQPWCWDDGTPLDMSTTQQHWLPHSDALHLVCTRKDASNANVIRWRALLFIAQVDLKTLRLIRDTERDALPMSGDGVMKPDDVALMGNFQTTNVTPDESWVSVGEMLPKHGYRGDLTLGKIRWSRPNSLL